MKIEAIGRAKINLVLRVGPRRDDGFHEVETLMQSVSLHDRVVLSPADRTSVQFIWDGAPVGPLPHPPDLTERAISRMPRPAKAEVLKRIPIGAGLAGGSANAAAALLGMNTMIALPMTDEALLAIAAGLGSDVPFALRGGAALARGRGERLQKVDAERQDWWVLVLSSESLSTADVYRRHDELATPPGGDPDGAARELTDGDPKSLSPLLSNDLEAAAFDMLPELQTVKRDLLGAGVLGAVLSGSGPTIAGLCESERHARLVAKELATSSRRVLVVHTEGRGAEVLGEVDEG